jgi:hypothetical protein
MTAPVRTRFTGEAALAPCGKDRFIRLRSPDIYPIAGTVKKTRFAEAMEHAAYQTKVTDLDVIVERMQRVDKGFPGAFTAFLWGAWPSRGNQH